ncbi:collagen binding domain-containing protein [Granulicella sp. S156]|uniref:MSCRAMM family protein n=1 Tax=Granulicella sp. S156 TaxID=1747224 RepID=UPI00131C371B|nr:carboxypeptidase-like regulatory domain-containing protein [Granulicella sp. S156]
MGQGLCVTALLLATAATAQTHSATTPEQTGSVTGHVFCADTNQPARFAKVSLEPIADPPSSTPAASPGSASSPKPAFKPPAGGSGTVETTLDGSFTLTKIKPGDYYVVVQKQGYVKPRDMFTQKEIDDPTPAMRALVEQALPRVRVEANQTEHAEVRLDRGAAISGTILYDDGSPAAELSVQLLHKDANGKWVALTSSGNFTPGYETTTDDRGFFRMASLLSGEYMIDATLSLTDSKITSTQMPGGETMVFNTQTFRFSLPFYGSGTARIADAAAIKVRAGQELPGADMTIPLSKLHKLNGRVIAGRDGHVVNAASLSLVTRDDNKELASSDISREDGLFHFEFVPEGDYILKVSNARDSVWVPATPPHNASLFPQPDKERVLQAYGDTELPILLSGDMLDAIATVPPDAKPSTTSSSSQ